MKIIHVAGVWHHRVARGVVVAGTSLAHNDAQSSRSVEAKGEDVSVTATGLSMSRTAALAHTEAGTVGDTEVGDGESYYEVEVTVVDGRQIDVHSSFNVVGDEVEDGRVDD